MQDGETEHPDRREGEMQKRRNARRSIEEGVKETAISIFIKNVKKKTEQKTKYLITDNFQFINMHFSELTKNLLINNID